MIPANTSLIVRRVPVKSRGKKFETPLPRGGPAAAAAAAQPAPGTASALPLLAGTMTEQERMDALISQGAGWTPGQAVPQRPKFMQGVFFFLFAFASPPNLTLVIAGDTKPPPTAYQCHRCQQFGHWISNCPTNGDAKFDFKRVKKATGIPKAFLTTINEGDAQGQEGTLMLPDGGFAVVRTNEGSFRELAIVDAVEKDMVASLPEEFKCTLCDSVLVNATSMPCCKTNFCDKCIRKKLLMTKFNCPACKKTEVSPDSLLPNRELRLQIDQLRRRKVDEAKEALRGEKKAGAKDAAAASAALAGAPLLAAATEAAEGDPNRLVFQDPDRGTVTKVLNLGYKYEEVQRGKFLDKFINDERVCRDWDEQQFCRFREACQFLHPDEKGVDARGTKEERMAARAKMGNQAYGDLCFFSSSFFFVSGLIHLIFF